MLQKSYRGRSLEEFPVERELRGRGEQKETAAGGYRSRRPEKVPVERELRGGGKAEGNSMTL
jgi:hypothetical protein